MESYKLCIKSQQQKNLDKHVKVTFSIKFAVYNHNSF